MSRRSYKSLHLPRTWPLARLTIPLEGLSKQIDRLLEGYCFQILATNQHAEAHNAKVLQTATHLTWILAEYLADTIAWLMRSILGHDSKISCDKDTQQLLTPILGFAADRELLNSARRIRPTTSWRLAQKDGRLKMARIGSCEVFWAMTLRSCVIKTLNSS